MHQQAVKTLTDALGFGVALSIVRRWGGRDWQVPAKAEEGSALALTLGLEAARRVVELFGGQRLQLPRESHVMQTARNEAIWRECTVHKRSQQSVALEYGLTRQGVKIVLQKVEGERAAAGAATLATAQSGHHTAE